MLSPLLRPSFFLFVLLPATLFPAAKPEGKSGEATLMSSYEAVIDMYLSEHFDEAITLSGKIRQDYPDDPAGAFGLISTYQALRWNYRVRLYEVEIDSLIDLCITLSENVIKRDRRDPRGHFYYGCALGFRMLKSARLHKWIAAFRDARQLPKSFKKTLAYDPEFYDAHYGLGLYQYWLGAKGAMRYLPGASGKRKNGIAEMQLAADKGRFLKVNALYGLLAAHNNEKDYPAALAISEKLLQHYPKNPNLRYRRGRLFQELQEWPQAIDSFKHLIALLMSAKYVSYSFQVDALFQTARSYYALGNLQETEKYSEQAIGLLERCDLSRELESPYEDFADIKKGLRDLNKHVRKDILAAETQK